jgi:hypothetical protein
MKQYAIKAYGEEDVTIHIFLTLALAGGKWSASRSAALALGKGSRYPLDRRLVGPQSRAGRRGVDKILDLNGTRTPPPLSSSL